MFPGRSYKQDAKYFSEAEKTKIKSLLKTLLEAEEKVCFSYLYGSFIDDVPVHDIDIGLHVNDISEDEVTFYTIDLGEKLTQDIGITVDVKVINFAPIPFQYSVMRGALLTEQDPDIYAARFEYVVGRYLDMKPLLIKTAKEAFGNNA